MVIRVGRLHDMEGSMNVLSWHGRSQVKTQDRQFAVRIIEALINPLWEIQRQCERSYIHCR